MADHQVGAPRNADLDMHHWRDRRAVRLGTLIDAHAAGGDALEYSFEIGDAGADFRLRPFLWLHVVEGNLDGTLHEILPAGENAPPLPFPLVFKFDWGGEGQTVFLIESARDLARQLDQAAAFEQSGQSGLLLQSYIPHGHRALRVVMVIPLGYPLPHLNHYI